MSELPGKAVVDGRVRFLSVSALEKADPRSSGCFRKWHYRYVEGKDEGDKYKEQQDAGKALHAEIATYLQTGVKAISPLVLKGMHFVPDPGPDLWVEQAFHTIDKGTIRSMLTAGGVPLIGYIDVVNPRGTNKNAEESCTDPDGTIEVIDWKRKGKTKDRNGNSTLKLPGELIQTIQMAGYGELVRRTFAEKVRHIRLSHGYFPESEPPRKVTKLHVVDDFPKAWNYVEGVARTIVDVAKEQDSNKVPANVSACNAFGGCPHREYCTGYRSNALDSLFGKVASDFAAEFKETNMSLLSQLPPVQTDMKAKLAAEEAQLRAQQAATQGVAPPGFADAWNRIEAHKRGTPTLGANAAAAYAAAFKRAITPGAGVMGTGQLAALNLMDPQHVFQLAAELDNEAPPEPAASAAPPPPPTPAPTPAPAETPVATLINILPPETPPSEPRRAASPPVQTASPTAVAEPASKKRKTKEAPKATAEGGLEIYVDCVPNCETVSLNLYIDILNKQLAAKYCVTSHGEPTLQDIRVAPKDSVLSFGAWKGALHAVVRECPPEPGSYALDTRGNEMAEIVADALRSVCAQNGYLYVRGVR